MLRRLRDMLGVHLQLWRRRGAFRRWQAARPGGSYGQFYAEGARERGGQADRRDVIRPKTLGNQVNQDALRRRAASLLDYLKWAGCRPEHVVVDFGCGSLWIGETLMSYLAPGRFIGLDVVDFFYREALERMGAGFVAERQPMLDVIAPAALARARERNPDFVISTAVLRHVRPQELAEHFRQLTSLCGPATRIIIGHEARAWTSVAGFQSLHHSRRAIAAALAPLGYAPRFDRLPGAPECRVALFEIVPATRA